MDKTVDYKMVYIHYDKPMWKSPDFGLKKDEWEGLEYTEFKDEAVVVTVYLQTHYKDRDGEELSEFDTTEHVSYDIKKGGHDKAKRDALKCAEKLAELHSCEYEWY
tara:strand:+ start:99 stop:416 length:318 start_codon:yes stop_codon:yes gene_type:complete